MAGPCLDIIRKPSVCLISGNRKEYHLWNMCNAFSQENSTRTPVRGVTKFTILVDPSVVLLSIYLVYLIHAPEERRFLKNYFFFLYDWNATPLHKNPGPRDHAIYNIGRSILSHYFCVIVLSDICPGVDTEEFFFKIMHFHYMTCGHAPAQEPLSGRSWNLQFWYTLSVLLLYTHFGWSMPRSREDF